MTKNLIKGEIGYYKLTDWWLNNLSEDERKIIFERYQPLGGNGSSLLNGEIKKSSQSVLSFFTSLLSWFQDPSLSNIAYKIIEKSEQFISKETDILSKHFYFQAKMQVYYRNRNDDSTALDKAIEACYQQIELSEEAFNAWIEKFGDSIIPTHAGFKQLCIIREKQGNLDEVIKLSQNAINNGWSGDWEKRIEKCSKKMNK